MTRRVASLAAVGLFLLDSGVAAGRTVHVDCGARPGGTGSLARPLNSLERASTVVLRPGTRLLLRRGSRCAGTLDPAGSGSPRKRVVIGAYGKGRRPRIDATGPDGLVLRNVSHVTARDLELTNRGDGSIRRRGIHVVADGVVVRDVTVRGMFVHDVGGDLHKDTNGSGGIQVDVLGSGRYDDLLISANTISEVTRSGISIGGTTDRTRPSADEAWPEASTRVVVRGNRLDRLGGDGIVPRGTVGAIVEDNVVSNGNLRGHLVFDLVNYVCNAGIWTFHANGTVIQRNEVFGMRFNGCDGTGFDIDYDQDGTVVQFNYSHDNEGGFILLCGEDDLPRRAVVRFNLSVDDATTLNEAPCRLAEGHVGSLDGVRFHNNTIVATRPNLTAELVPLPLIVGAGSFEFVNNVVVATASQLLPLPCGEHCARNLFFNLPASGTAAVVGDPRFSAPGVRGRGRLEVGDAFRPRVGSPAARAGVRVGDMPTEDYFGDPVDAAAPTLGFAQRLKTP